MGENDSLARTIRGLGREGVQITHTLWRILRNHGFVRTADEEEQRRFLAAEVVPVPETDFGKCVHRLLRACMNTCPQLQHMTFEFVNAGTLQLYSYYHEPEALLKLHDRWLDVESAVNDLGLPEGQESRNVAFYAAKELFAEALERVPDGGFKKDERPARWHQRREKILAEERVSQYMRMTSALEFRPPSFDISQLLVSWRDCDVRVNLQLHELPRCALLRQRLTTGEGKPADSTAEKLGILRLMIGIRRYSASSELALPARACGRRSRRATEWRQRRYGARVQVFLQIGNRSRKRRSPLLRRPR